MVMIFNPDSLRQQVEAASGGHVTVLYDDKGYPSYMRVIPKFRYEDLGYEGELGAGVATAFLVDGQEKSEIFIGQYLASVYDGRAVSLAGKDPRASINFDSARAACTSKGPGWHLMTRHEWAAIALWCMANGFEPRGNTNYGRAHDAHHETAVRYDGQAPGVTGGTARTRTGGGPASWRHDGGITGIADLVGNVWEWSEGLKLIDGQIICIEDNNFSLDEESWTELGHYVSNESGTPTLMNSPGVSNDDSINSTWSSLAKDGGYTESQLLQRLLVSPTGTIKPQGRFSVRTEGERLPSCGGNWANGVSAGLAALACLSPRSYSYNNLGFRPAFLA